jgi:hypothetical protein
MNTQNTLVRVLNEKEVRRFESALSNEKKVTGKLHGYNSLELKEEGKWIMSAGEYKDSFDWGG